MIKITLTGTLKSSVANTTLSGGTVTLNGGALEVDEDINFISDLAQQANSSIVVANGRISIIPEMYLTLVAQVLTLSGAGVFA